MSIKRQVLFSFLSSLTITFIISVFVLYAVFSRTTESRVIETYNLIYESYKKLLKREEEIIKFLPSIPENGKYVYFKVEDDKKGCLSNSYYRLAVSNTYYGLNKQFSESCYFVGVSVYEVLSALREFLSVDWIVYYQRDFISDVIPVNELDMFMKDKMVVSDKVIDRFSNNDMLALPIDIRGYSVYGGLTRRYILVEAPIVDNRGLSIGKVVLSKEISYIYKETYITLITLVIYSILIYLFASYLLFRVASNLIERVILLKNITLAIEKRDFSVLQKIEKLRDRWKDEVEELKQSVYSMASNLRDAFDELEIKNKELEKLAYYDPLTNLPNRRFFFDHANLVLENSKRYKIPMSILIIDLDHFKVINDTYGHEAGDIVLKSFADILRKNIRQSDLPARLGGEEFALLMPNTDLEQAKIVGERLRNELENSRIVYQGQEIRATVSGGIASYVDGVESIDELLRRSDEALYRAKEMGRNRIEVYEVRK
jgi:diguanylate cyclase (GGDEF)-like protein